jgi:hypothetical protein
MPCCNAVNASTLGLPWSPACASMMSCISHLVPDPKGSRDPSPRKGRVCRTPRLTSRTRPRPGPSRKWAGMRVSARSLWCDVSP